MDKSLPHNRLEDVDFIPHGTKTDQEKLMETEKQLNLLTKYCIDEGGMTKQEVLDVRRERAWPNRGVITERIARLAAEAEAAAKMGVDSRKMMREDPRLYGVQPSVEKGLDKDLLQAQDKGSSSRGISAAGESGQDDGKKVQEESPPQHDGGRDERSETPTEKL